MDLLSWFSLYLIAISNVVAEVSLIPSGNVYLCPGILGSLTCMTTAGPLLWTSDSRNRLFNSLQSSVMLGNLTLSVQSVMVTGNTLSVTSTATINDFLVPSNGLLVVCSETTTGMRANATFVAGPGPAPVTSSLLTQSSTNSSLLLISWSMSDCAVQYVVTIINSSDDSVYPNITTSDTNTTVTLPTGVEFCVTVLGVDSINRTGPASEPQCYPPIITTSMTSSSSSNSASSHVSSTPSSTPPVSPPSGVSGGAIAGAVIAVIMIILAVLVTAVAVIVNRKGYYKKSKNHELELVAYVYDEYHLDCHTFYQDHIIPNSWKVVFVFVPFETDVKALKMFYKDYHLYSSLSDCRLKSSRTIQLKVTNKRDGWTVYTADDHQVHKAAIEGYTGKGSPPHIEMLITAASNKTTPPDLTVEAELEGVQKPNIIKFEKEAQNVVKCVYQVFCHKEARNHWRATFAFFPKQYLKKVNDLYQDANNCSFYDIMFPGGDIKIVTDVAKIPAGWEVTINSQHPQVTTAAVEQYTGEGEPPYCEMTLRATDSDKSALTILQLPVTFIGVREQNSTFSMRRALVAPDGAPLFASQPIPSQAPQNNYRCQVFYHRQGLNYWKATLAFFSKNSPIPQRVQLFYQDANSDPPVDIEFAASVDFVPLFKSKIKPNFNQPADGWTMAVIEQHKKVTYEEVERYVRTGLGTPPHCEISLKADSDETTPPDLILNIVLSGVNNECNKLVICRAAEIVVVNSAAKGAEDLFNSAAEDLLAKLDIIEVSLSTTPPPCPASKEGNDELREELDQIKNGDDTHATPEAPAITPCGDHVEGNKEEDNHKFPMHGTPKDESTHRCTTYYVNFPKAKEIAI